MPTFRAKRANMDGGAVILLSVLVMATLCTGSLGDSTGTREGECKFDTSIKLKYFPVPATYAEAALHCRSIEGDVVSDINCAQQFLEEIHKTRVEKKVDNFPTWIAVATGPQLLRNDVGLHPGSPVEKKSTDKRLIMCQVPKVPGTAHMPEYVHGRDRESTEEAEDGTGGGGSSESESSDGSNVTFACTGSAKSVTFFDVDLLYFTGQRLCRTTGGGVLTHGDKCLDKFQHWYYQKNHRAIRVSWMDGGGDLSEYTRKTSDHKERSLISEPAQRYGVLCESHGKHRCASFKTIDIQYIPR
eukprot:scpid94305/ scgid12917/ 